MSSISLVIQFSFLLPILGITSAVVNGAFLRCPTLNHWSLPKFHITVKWMIWAAFSPYFSWQRDVQSRSQRVSRLSRKLHFEMGSWWLVSMFCFQSRVRHDADDLTIRNFLFFICEQQCLLGTDSEVFSRCLFHALELRVFIHLNWMKSKIRKIYGYLIHNCSGLKRCREKVNASAYQEILTRLANSFFYQLLHLLQFVMSRPGIF